MRNRIDRNKKKLKKYIRIKLTKVISDNKKEIWFFIFTYFIDYWKTNRIK